ncbi:MAG: putative phage abortive infection protein [Acidimicrobiia bacterium]
MTERQLRRVTPVAIVAFGGVMLLWIVVGFGPPLIWPGLRERALWGDAFGLVGALFSGLAFAGVVVALFFQNRELELQSAEIARARQAMEEQREVVATQLASIESQRTEAAFFALLEMHRDTVSDLDLGGIVTGRQALHHLALQMHRLLQETSGSLSPVQRAEQAYGELSSDSYPYMGHYFRLVGEILRFLGAMEDTDRALTYGRLLRAQLSSDELLLLMVWMLSGDVNERDGDIAEHAEEFGIFRGLHFMAIDASYGWLKTAWHELAVSMGSEKLSFRSSGRFE